MFSLFRSVSGVTMDDNEYLSSSKIIFYGLKIIGIFPFISIQKAKTNLLRDQFLTFISLTFYSIAFINEIQFVYKTMIPLFRKFDFLYFVKVLPITHTRLYVIFIPIMAWNKCSEVHNYWNNWRKYQKELELVTKTPYHSPVKTKIRLVSALGILTTILITSNTNFESIYYVIIRTGVSSVGYCMVLLEMMPILWYINCKYIESMAKTIIYLIQESILIKSEKNIHHLTNLWIDLCNLNIQFNRTNSSLYLGYLSLLIVNLINTLYFAFYLYTVEHNKAIGKNYLIPSLFCIINIIILYEAANSASKQITSKIGSLILSCNTINLDGQILRSIMYFFDVMETKNPELNFGGLVTLDRSKLLSLWTMVIYYLIVLKQFATV